MQCKSHDSQNYLAFRRHKSACTYLTRGKSIKWNSMTSTSPIALSILVTNLFSVDLNHFFVLYFTDCSYGEKHEHYIIIEDEA